MLNGVTSNIQNQIDALGGSTTVVDNLTSTSTTSALSANQGRVLKDEIDELNEITPITVSTSRNALATDANGVVMLSGGTTITVQQESTVAIPVNTAITYVNDGASAVNIDFVVGVVGTDVTLSKHEQSVTIWKTASNVWTVLNAPQVVLEPFVGTGTALDLSGQGYYNTSNSATTYTFTNGVVGGWARVLINAATEPAVTGATKITGADFEASTPMYMVVSYNGAAAEYYFLEI